MDSFQKRDISTQNTVDIWIHGISFIWNALEILKRLTANSCAKWNPTWKVLQVDQHRKITVQTQREIKIKEHTQHPSQGQAKHCNNLQNWLADEHLHLTATEHTAWFGRNWMSSVSIQRRFITALICSLRLFLLSIKESLSWLQMLKLDNQVCVPCFQPPRGKNRLMKMSFHLAYARHVLDIPLSPLIIKRKQ